MLHFRSWLATVALRRLYHKWLNTTHPAGMRSSQMFFSSLTLSHHLSSLLCLLLFSVQMSISHRRSSLFACSTYYFPTAEQHNPDAQECSCKTLIKYLYFYAPGCKLCCILLNLKLSNLFSPTEIAIYQRTVGNRKITSFLVYFQLTYIA